MDRLENSGRYKFDREIKGISTKMDTTIEFRSFGEYGVGMDLDMVPF